MAVATTLYLQEEKGNTEFYQLQNNVTVRIKSSRVDIRLRPKCVHIDDYHKLYFSYAELYFFFNCKKDIYLFKILLFVPFLTGQVRKPCL